MSECSRMSTGDRLRIVSEAQTFRPGVLGDYDSVKDFAIVGSDGPAGRITWGSYVPGESYLVVTTGRLRRKHRVLPAGAVVRVSDRSVLVGMSRAEIERLPVLAHPEAALGDETVEQMINAFEREASLSIKL